MQGEETYRKEYGAQVAKYLAAFGLTEEDLAKLINSSSDNIRAIVSGKVGLSLGKMIKIANVFSVHYYQFANPSYSLPEERHLSKNTKKKIEKRKSIGIISREKTGLLANELDRLIAAGTLNSPKTAKAIHQEMHYSLQERSATEVTNLLNKAPRNKIIVKLQHKLSKENLYVHQDFADEYNALDPTQLTLRF